MFHDNSYICETYDENLVKLNFHLRQTAMKRIKHWQHFHRTSFVHILHTKHLLIRNHIINPMKISLLQRVLQAKTWSGLGILLKFKKKKFFRIEKNKRKHKSQWNRILFSPRLPKHAQSCIKWDQSSRWHSKF